MHTFTHSHLHEYIQKYTYTDACNIRLQKRLRQGGAMSGVPHLGYNAIGTPSELRDYLVLVGLVAGGDQVPLPALQTIASVTC
jgi:hypothetical protein